MSTRRAYLLDAPCIPRLRMARNKREPPRYLIGWSAWSLKGKERKRLICWKVETTTEVLDVFQSNTRLHVFWFSGYFNLILFIRKNKNCSDKKQKYLTMRCNIWSTVLKSVSNVMYKASCWDCQDFYIGKTKRRLHDKKTEHFKAITNTCHMARFQGQS